MNIHDLTESLISILKKTEYGKESFGSRGSVVSDYGGEADEARVAISQWIQDSFSQQIIEVEQYKQRVVFLEEMVKKSTFAPMVDDTPRGEELIDLLLLKMQQSDYSIVNGEYIRDLENKVIDNLSNKD